MYRFKKCYRNLVHLFTDVILLQTGINNVVVVVVIVVLMYRNLSAGLYVSLASVQHSQSTPFADSSPVSAYGTSVSQL
jgi:hypothetical protein